MEILSNITISSNTESYSASFGRLIYKNGIYNIDVFYKGSDSIVELLDLENRNSINSRHPPFFRNSIYKLECKSEENEMIIFHNLRPSSLYPHKNMIGFFGNWSSKARYKNTFDGKMPIEALDDCSLYYTAIHTLDSNHP